MGVTREQIRQARNRDLYGYLRSAHRNEVENDGCSLRLAGNRSISVRKGYSGYRDFESGETGNGIDLLTRYLGYGFIDAVMALNGSAERISGSRRQKSFMPPERSESCERIKSYLTTGRGLDKRTVEWLIGKEVLYQDTRSNCVFINPDGGYYEVRGIYDRPYHANGDRSEDNTGYWYFNAPEAKLLTRGYICESCIDAISLYQLTRDEAYYFAVGGVGNQQRIDMIKRLPLEIKTAFDNDEAGSRARERNKDIAHLIPELKDWNEDLLSQRR